MTDKIKEHHLARKSMLYVRQSSPHQVVHNEESRRLQYAMESRLKQLGWSEVEVIDEDLGQTAAGTAMRVGFERMVAEVCLGKVGAVSAREVSRFARNSRDWQQLVEVCRMVDTLLIDQETIYDPRQGNDRLLLGVKGTLNEYELDVLRLRSLEARREKARRGELVVIPPVGYVKTDDQQLEMDPDRRVQEAIARVFTKFLEVGSVRQAMLWLIEHGLEIPTRRHGAAGWETVWKRPTYQSVLRILRNPIYAGAYAYGKTEACVAFEGGVPTKKTRRKPMDQWLALIYDHHEGYVDRVTFERIQELISKNAQAWQAVGGGAAKHGAGLLVGLLRCRRCGRKLMVSYSGRAHDVLRYVCRRGALNTAESSCISLGGLPADDAVAKEALRVVRPCAVEASVHASREAQGHRDDVVEALSLDLQAARYAADRAWRQFDAVDPDNRLVIDELERRWNSALERVRELEQRIDREAVSGKSSPPDPEMLRGLAADLDRVWNDPATDVRLKKRVLRTLIEEVIVDVDPDAGEIDLVIHWKGGVHTELRVARRRRGQNRLHTSPEVVESVRTLARICSDEVIAGYLNRNGLRTGHGLRWTRERVTSLRSKRRIAKHSAELQEASGCMNLTQAAAHVNVTPAALRRAVERGDVQATHPLPDGPWIFERDHLAQPGVRAIFDRLRRRRGGATQTPQDISLFKATT